MKDMLLSLADELEGMDVREGCRTCPADGTKDCRGDLSCEEAVARAVARRVREIVEHDECEVTTVSAYDLLPEDEREAIAWVREQGGIVEVKDEWKRRNNLKRRLEKAQDKVGRQQRHIEELQRKLAERRDRINAMRSQMAEMRSRLMPDGMEWPRFEDSEPVRFGDEFVDCNGDTGVVYTVKFGKNAFRVRSIEGNVIALEHGERVKRPAPKVVDADGVEIHAGDVLYSIETGDAVTVDSIEPGNPWFATTDSELQHCAKFTHRAPVLAADGEPLEVGQTVYVARYEYQKCTVLSFEWVHDDWLVEVENEGGHKFRLTPDEFTHQRPVLDADGVLCREGDEVWEVRSHRRREIVGTHYRDYETGEPLILCDGDDAIPIPATCVTHTKPEPPDSWERLNEDAKKNPFDYCKDVSHRLDTCENAERYKARDLVRRCCALAEGGACDVRPANH